VSTHTTTQPLRGSYLFPPLEDATVSDAMHPGIHACPADMPLRSVARMMSNYRVHAVAVLGVADDDDPSNGTQMVHFFVFDRSSCITGQVWDVHGGMDMR
jgi:CBS domain-containing protein